MFTLKSFSRILSILIVAVCLLTLVGPAHAAPASLVEPVKADETPSLLQFTAGGHILGFTASGIYAVTGSHAFHVDFVGARNVQPQAEAAATSTGEAVPLSRVQYPNLWQGITLTYDAPSDGILRSTYQLEAGAEVSAIQLRYNAPLTINSDGSLSIIFETGALTESDPRAWQVISGKRVPVTVSFAQYDNNEVGFALGRYDARYPLTIDPTLTWNTFLIENGDDRGQGIAVDGSGNIYLTGTSTATDSIGNDVFVSKLNSSGGVIWTRFLGGNGEDQGYGVAVDGSGNVYISGWSTSAWGAPVRAFSGSNGFYDAFAAKLDSSGGLIWNTFLGGSHFDRGYRIALDGSGNVYVTGSSQAAWGCSSTSCTVQAYTQNGSPEAFVAKVNNDNGALIWNTFLGSLAVSLGSVGWGVAVDGSGNVYVTGYSSVTWGTPVRSFSSTGDIFVAKLNSSGALIWNTFLGPLEGTTDSLGPAIAVDGSGNVYVAGYSSVAWGCSPTPCTVQAYADNGDAFAAKLDNSGNLIWNTFLGGSGGDAANGIAVDGSSNVYVTGYSITTWGTPMRAHNPGGNSDTFAAKLDSNGALAWNTFLGGSGDDRGNGIAVDGSGNVYVGGYSNATWSTPVQAYVGGNDAFTAKLPPPSTNANLSSLILSTGAFSPMFAAGTTSYTQSVDNAVTSLTVTPTLADATATVQVNGVTVAAGSASSAINLLVGDNVITIVVTAEDSTTTKTYAITVTRAPDTTAPTIASIIRADANFTNAVSVNFTITFTESVTGIDTLAPFNDFVVYTTGVTDALVTSVSGSGSVYTVTVNTGSGNGTIRLDVSDNDAITDAAGNPLGGSGLGNGDYVGGETYTVDKIAPDTQIDSQPASSSASASATFTFSSADGTATFECSLDSGAYAACASPKNYPGLAEGGHIFDVRAKDPAGNVDGTPASYAWTIDTIAPKAISIVRTDLNPTNAASVRFTVAFSEPVTGVDPTDFSLNTSGVTGSVVTSLSGSGAAYIVTVNTGTGNGTLRLDISDNDSVVDAAGNPLGGTGLSNGSFSTGEVYTIDKTVTLSVSSTGSQDGWVLESSETSNTGGSVNAAAATIRLGDDAARRQYRGILSFATGASLPDTAVITGVTLRIRDQSIVGGGNPVTMFQGFMVDIKNGFFGTTALQTTDFQTAASHSYGPFKPTPAGSWYSVDLTSANGYINKLALSSGLTQIRLRFKLDDNSNAVANYLSFFSGNAAAADRPRLIITYHLP